MIAKHRFVFVVVLPLLGIALTAGCGGDEAGQSGVEMAALEMMPQSVQQAPKSVRQAYQFAVANPQVLQQLPCYCGCGGMGHTSNYSCYVSVMPDGTRRFEGHALGCSICVDIALDAMRMLKQNKSVAEMRLLIDVRYSQYGPSNMS
jgi:hypothetical protein